LRSNAASGPFSSQPCGLRAFWPAALSLIGQRPPRVFSLFASRIQPKFAAAPLHQSLTWCTSVSETGMSSVSTTNICGTDNDFDRPLRDGASLHRYPGTSCLATISLSLRDKSHLSIDAPHKYL